jgi:cobalt-zinc-cadmium efflux system outer membrane protein
MRKWPLSLVICFCSLLAVAQPPQLDTLRLSLPQAEKLFLDSNFQLLAQRYNVDATKALVIQARLWPNPNFSISNGPVIPISNLPDYPRSTFFHESELAAGLSQLVLIAGKRNKQIKLAEANVQLSEYQFFDLLRTLKYTLRTDFFQIYYLKQSASVYNEEINALQQISAAFAQQEGKGYISEKEVVRIQAQLYSFQSEYNDLINQINDTESELRLVLQTKPHYFIDPAIDSNAIAALDPGKYPLTTLVDSAYHNRTDLLIARANTKINQLNYNYQKSLAWPDLTLNAGYDKQGSFANNFTSLGASFDLPFFNRNQGNIKNAKILVQSTRATEKSTIATVDENVARSLQKAYDERRLVQTIDPKFFASFDRLMQQVLINYQKRNISILDFLDFYDSYKQNALQVNTIRFNLVSAFEDINYYTGTNFFN